MSRPPYPPHYPPAVEDRYILPDVYPRRSDPFAPVEVISPPAGTPSATPDISVVGGTPGQADLYKDAITMPAVRPVAYQRAFNITVAVTDSPIAIQSSTFQCDAFLISVPSTSANSTFFGFGSGISSGNGSIEVRPGLPQFYSPSNVREQWEIQRILESIAAMLNFMIYMKTGGSAPGTLGPFMSPRVVLNAHDYYLVNATGITQNVSVMLFTVPEFQ